MSQITEFLDLICSTVERKCGLSYSISLKELPKDGGLYAEVGEGFTNALYYDKSTIVTVPVMFLCRDANQLKGVEQLSSICNYLRKLKVYPQGKTFNWIDTTVVKEPNKIARDEDGTYHFSCILNCRLTF